MTPEDSRALLQWARAEFPCFYGSANARDIAMFDALVLSRVEFAAGISAPRKGLPHDARQVLERHTDAREREYAGLRDAVLHCDTFRALDAGERGKITQTLFDPPEPWTT